MKGTNMNGSTKFKSMAWLLRGISSIPGELKLADGRLSFKAFGFGTFWRFQLDRLEQETGQPSLAERLDNGETAMVFHFPVSDVDVRFPWYYFSGGLVITVESIKYKFSFGRPANTGTTALNKNVLQAMNELREAGNMRQTGKAWRKALGR